MIDLNADVGEGFDDGALLPHVTSANVACGFHAGDPRAIEKTVALCARLGVAVGAHPSYDDREGFGRRPLAVDPEELQADIVYQVGALAAFARAHGVPLAHVKPHGALYNQAAIDATLARVVARAVSRVAPGTVLVGLAGSEAQRRAAAEAGLRFAAEAFADRRYEADGTLRSRKLDGALIEDPGLAAAQAVAIARDGYATTADGVRVRIASDTLCLHGDTPGAVANAQAVRRALAEAGISVHALAV